MTKTYNEINQKIKNGEVVVVTAEEMIKIVEEDGVKVAAEDIDVVTTGTFGPMCSSGTFLNFGHSDPPIKFEHLWLNDVKAYHGNAAVDCYIGCTRMSDVRRFEYGGGHVIEDLVSGKSIRLRGNSYTTDCYPLAEIDTEFTLEEINQAILVNPRNAYQRYVCAVNSSDRTLYTYMGKLLPHFGNAHYAGAGCLSPLSNDPNYETIGFGTRIFLGGGSGYIIGEGTQHSPTNQFGTLFVKGDLKQMSSEYLRGVSYEKYGTSLFVGLGIPIPILNEGLAKKTAVSDSEIFTDIVDYGVPRRDKPKYGQVTYEELKNEYIDLDGKKIKCSSMSSLHYARRIAETLKKWIQEGKFFLNPPAETLPTDTTFKPMKQTLKIKFVKDLKREAIICYDDCELKTIAKRIVSHDMNHIVITDRENNLKGIVTSFDITKAIAEEKTDINEIITKKVVTASDNDPIDVAARRMKQNYISALPVINENKKVVGIITSEELI
ncbi:MAG: homocysteine biosynthesis protein [Promethearchaeota archaeon]